MFRGATREPSAALICDTWLKLGPMLPPTTRIFDADVTWNLCAFMLMNVRSRAPSLACQFSRSRMRLNVMCDP